MSDTTLLYRMAVEEIMRDVNQAKQLELQKTSQKITNPLRKANKRFLGRTINSMLTHNKREDDRKLQNCRLRLQELDRTNQRVCEELSAGNKQSRSRSRSCSLSCSEDSSTAKRRKRKLKKRKKRKRTKARRSISADRRSASSEHIGDTFQTTTPPIRQSQECEEEAIYGEPYSRGEMAYGVNMLDYYYRINQHYSTLAVCNEMKDLCQSVLTSASLTGNSVQNICTSDTAKKCGNLVSTSPRSLSSLDEDLRSELEISLSADTESKIQTNECSPQRYSDIELLSSSDSEHNQIDENVFINVDSESLRGSISESESSIALISCSSESEASCTSKKEHMKSPLTCTSDKEDEESNIMIDLTAE